MNDGECADKKCCARLGNNAHGPYKKISKPGREWCPLKEGENNA